MSKRRRAMVSDLVALGCGGLVLASCSILVPVDEVQCTTASDCAARGPTFANAVCANHVCTAPTAGDDAGAAGVPDATAEAEGSPPVGPWRCLGHAPEVLDPAMKVDVTLVALDALQPITTAGATGGSDLTYVAGTTLSGVTVRACNPLDPVCGTQVTPDSVTDDAGVVQLTVPANFDGFYLFSRNNLVTTYFYFGPLSGAPHESYPAPVPSKIGGQLLAQSLGVTVDLSPDASVGHIFMNAYDCDDRSAPGVTFTLSNTDARTVTWYLKNGLPTTTATETDRLGAAGAVNVPVGPLVVTATLVDGQRSIGSSNVVVHPGAITIAYFRTRTR